MGFTLSPDQHARLIAFVDRRVLQQGCDHTLRFAEEWAEQEGVDWDDLLDLLEAHGGFCDCEVVMNVSDRAPNSAEPVAELAVPTNRWLIPDSYRLDPTVTFSKVVVCETGLGFNSHANDGEWLVPAPRGVKARKRVRKSVNFFIGCQSGLPTEIGLVQECPAISASDFAAKVVAAGFEELAGFGACEAGFVLSCLANLKAGVYVGTNYMDRVGLTSRYFELTVHRVIMR